MDHSQRNSTARATALLGTWVIAAACASSRDDGGGTTLGQVTGITGVTTDAGTSSTGPLDASSDDAGTTSGVVGSSSSDDGGPPTIKLDVGVGDSGDLGCPDDDICCVLPGELPPHAVLDEFIAAYPLAQMPQDLAMMQSFVPALPDVQMAWSALNTGDELVDPDNGGLVEPNLETGRTYAHNAALAAVPTDATIIDVREDPPVIADLGGPGSCVGVGWAWGSILFEAVDGAIDEVVYLYVGYCSSDGDSENFFYSNEAAQVCAPPA